MTCVFSERQIDLSVSEGLKFLYICNVTSFVDDRALSMGDYREFLIFTSETDQSAVRKTAAILIYLIPPSAMK